MIFIILMAATALFPTPTGLIITEIQIHGEDQVTIFNPGTENLDISGFRLRKRSSTGKESSVRVFPKESEIVAGGSFIWSNSKNNHHLKIGADVWSRATISNNNSIALISPEGDIVDSVAWGEGTDQFLSGKPIFSNPSEDQIIRRRTSDEGYHLTGDNSKDFELYPGVKFNLLNNSSIRRWTREKDEGTSPIALGGGIAILSALSILILKRSIF